MKNPLGKYLTKTLALAVGMACAQFALAQTFKHVNVQGGAALTQISSGGTSVWALGSNHHPYIYAKPQFVLANNISLTQIAVGGGNAVQADAVWGLDSSGRIYHAHLSGTSWVFSRVPGVLDLIAVGPGYRDTCHPYEVWGLNPGAQIYRYNYCTKGFDQVPGILCDIKVGFGDVWGAQCGPSIFRFYFPGGVFLQVDSHQFKGFPALTVAPNGNVWAIDTGDNGGRTYLYDPVSVQFLLQTSGSSQIQAGGEGIWAIRLGNVYHLDNAGIGVGEFVQVPGSLVSLSVGTGGGVWGINGAGQALVFTTP